MGSVIAEVVGKKSRVQLEYVHHVTKPRLPLSHRPGIHLFDKTNDLTMTTIAPAVSANGSKPQMISLSDSIMVSINKFISLLVA